MILGMWGGNTPQAVQRKLDRIASLREEVSGDIERAVADRTAAIAELKAELGQLLVLKSQL
jgi:hypothetical protein